MQFQQNWPKDKNSSSFRIFWLKTEKIGSTKHYVAPLEGLTIFLQRSSTSSTPLESSRLAELKFAFFSRTGRKTKITGLEPLSIGDL